jgi:hypothetical protein
VAPFDPSIIKKQQQPQDTRRDQFINEANKYGGGGSGGLTFTGTQQEQEGQLAGLNTAQAGYGENLFQTGKNISDIRSKFKERVGQGGGDPISAAIMGQKAGAVSNAQRSLAASGVKGGVAAGATEAIGRQQDESIAKSLYGQQRQSLQDLKNLESNTLAGTVALMQGSKAEGTAAGIPAPPKPQGFFESLFGGLF